MTSAGCRGWRPRPAGRLGQHRLVHAGTTGPVDDAPGRQHDRLVGGPPQRDRLLLDEDHPEPVGVERPQRAVHLGDHQRRQATGRLVERSSRARAALARAMASICISPPLRLAQFCHDRSHNRGRYRSMPAQSSGAALVRAEEQVLLDGQPRQQAAALRDEHEPLPRAPGGAHPRQVLRPEGDVPLPFLGQPGERAQQRRLVGAVGILCPLVPGSCGVGWRAGVRCGGLCDAAERKSESNSSPS